MSQFKEMLVLKIEESRAAMAQIEKELGGEACNNLAYNCHSEVVMNLELALGNMVWLEKYE